MPRLFSCCLSVSIVFIREFVTPYRSVDRSDEIVKDFYRLPVMSVDFRLFVNNDLFDERAQYFGREFFKTVIQFNRTFLLNDEFYYNVLYIAGASVLEFFFTIDGIFL